MFPMKPLTGFDRHRIAVRANSVFKGIPGRAGRTRSMPPATRTSITPAGPLQASAQIGHQGLIQLTGKSSPAEQAGALATEATPGTSRNSAEPLTAYHRSDLQR
jgi:hypothetical protein